MIKAVGVLAAAAVVVVVVVVVVAADSRALLSVYFWVFHISVLMSCILLAYFCQSNQYLFTFSAIS
jgi:lipid-A-disaccharide synthase-like uncharacterized protein